MAANTNRSAPRTGLSTRERRAWSRKLEDAQEAVEQAEADRAKAMVDAYAAGFPLAGIENATGLGPHTVRNNIPGSSRKGSKPEDDS